MYALSRKKRKKPKLRETPHTETKRTIRSLIITLSLMIATLGTIFLVTTSQSSQRGYALEQEKLKNEYLKDINSEISTKITTEKAFSEIEENEKINKMTEIEEKEYVTKEDNLVK